MVRSSRRPVPLKIRSDLVVERIDYREEASFVIKDPVGLKYHRLRPEQYHVLKLLDGERSLEDIRDDLKREFPAIHFRLQDIQQLITDLHKSGLACSDRYGQAAPLIQQRRKERRKKILNAARNLLYIRLPGWDPERGLTAMYPWFRWMFRPWAVSLAVVLVVAAWALLAVQFDRFVSRLPEFQQFFGWPNLLYMWLTLSLCKIVHEYGHGLSCKHFGGECHEMGVMLLVFSPCLYCDVTDSWMLRNKWKRIAIAAAGMYIEVVLSAIAIFVWWYTTPGLIHHLALNVFFVTTITTVIFNANPLLRFDGYYMMADWLEIPNLRIKADKYLRDKFAWYCLGIESRPDPFLPESGRLWFAFYAVAAALYRWLVLFGITLFLYTVLKPYGLQSIGITLAVLSLAGIVGTLVFNVYRIISAPRTEPMSRPKIAMSLAAVGCFAAVALTIPIPWFIQSSLLVQPEEVRHVYVVTPGRLEELLVRPGQQVKRGDVLARLVNEATEDRHRDLQIQNAVQEKAVERYRFLGDPVQEKLTRERLDSLKSELQELEKQLAQLTIVAPADGTVVEPPRKPEPKLDPTQRRLNTWHGTPLEPRNLGSSLEAGTHLLSIAPSEKLEAVLLVDQADRNDIFVGQTVRMKFDHLPARTYEGEVDRISERQLDYAPEALSNKLGGDLATVTDEHGRERLTSSVYQASVVLDQDSDLFKSGMRGQARFILAKRTAWDWLWRAFRQTFHFRL